MTQQQKRKPGRKKFRGTMLALLSAKVAGALPWGKGERTTREEESNEQKSKSALIQLKGLDSVYLHLLHHVSIRYTIAVRGGVCFEIYLMMWIKLRGLRKSTTVSWTEGFPCW